MKNSRFFPLLMIAVFLLIPMLIGLLTYPSKVAGQIDLTFLPYLNSIINSCVTIFLLLGLFFARKKDVQSHRLCMITALLLSVLFLVSYSIYHSLATETKFCGDGWQRPVYFTLLLSHIVLAAPAAPLALWSAYQALKGNILAHKKFTRWAYPVWLYVSITGPIIYWMLSPCYQ